MLREVWMSIRVEKLDTHKGVTVKALYHKWSFTICDGCFDTLKSSKMRS